MAMNDDLDKRIAAAPVTVVRPPAQNIAESAGRLVRDVRESGQRAAALRDSRIAASVAGLNELGSSFRRGLADPAPVPAASAPVASPASPAATAPAAPPASTPPRAGAPGMQFNTGQPGDVQPPTQPNIGYFIGSDGKRRDITANQADALASRVQTVPSAAAAAGAAGAPLGATIAESSMPVVSSLRRPDAMALSQQAISIQRQEARSARNAALAPLADIGGGVPASELLRRKQNAEDSYFNKGSPSGRARAASAYDALLGAYVGASQQRQQQVGNTAAGAAAQEAEIGAGEVEGERSRGAALRDSMLRASLQREQLDASAPVLQLQGGNTGRVGRDGVVRTLVDEDGRPVRGQTEVQALDPNVVFEQASKARTEVLATLPIGATPEQRAAALAEFDAGPLGQALAAALPSSPQGSSASPPSPAAIEALRANPERAAEFDARYGQGASARLLQGQ